MAETGTESVLKRMAAAGREAAAAAAPAGPLRALEIAFRKAAQSEATLAASIDGGSERVASLSELLDGLPEQGLLGVLEGPGESQGLMVLDPVVLSTLIEKQTTGTVGATPPPARRATRTDAALAADLIDGTLRAFETALEGRQESRWAAGFGYTSHVETIRPLGLLLEEIDYRVFTLEADLELGKRKGRVILALPAEGRGPVVAPVARATDGRAGREQAAWEAALHANVEDGDIRLEAIMHRFRMPISALAELIPGEEIPLPMAALDDVRFVASDGRSFGRGRLGQSRGHRAVRLHGESPVAETALPFDNAEIHSDPQVSEAIEAAPEPDEVVSDVLDGLELEKLPGFNLDDGEDAEAGPAATAAKPGAVEAKEPAQRKADDPVV